MKEIEETEVIIVGAGVVGSAVAVALARDGRKVTIIERDWSEPDRIVGELIQPGGIKALHRLGLESVTDNIDATLSYGYAVFYQKESICLSYPEIDGQLEYGKSFHHGRFIIGLRHAALKYDRVTRIEGTVVELLKVDEEIVGVVYKSKNDDEEKKMYAPLTVVADGCFSRFRKELKAKEPTSKSNFVGLIMKNCTLPYENHGHVILSSHSTILLYRIGTNEVRILVDIPGKLPSNSKGELKDYMINNIVHSLPKQLRESFTIALKEDTLRSMPNNFASSTPYKIKGAIILGDAWNMRHPLTGGGMTVGLKDVVLLQNLLSPTIIPSFHDKQKVFSQLGKFYWQRKNHSSVINILAQALYSLFSSGNDRSLIILREGCFKYFQFGGRCVTGPMGLLGGLLPRPMLLIYHFFAVALYAIYDLFSSNISLYSAWECILAVIMAFRVISPYIHAEIRP